MKKIKIYCDICKQEFNETEFILELCLNRVGYTTDIDLKIGDICPKCAERIYDFIKEMENLG